MGIGRMFWRSTRVGRIIDTVENIKGEGSIVDGIKLTIKEDFCEDNPITSIIYKSGKSDGKEEGYIEASDEYKDKLLKQADEFLKQTKIYERERDMYEQLLDEYETEISKLSEKNNRTEIENQYLQLLLMKERKLRKME